MPPPLLGAGRGRAASEKLPLPFAAESSSKNLDCAPLSPPPPAPPAAAAVGVASGDSPKLPLPIPLPLGLLLPLPLVQLPLPKLPQLARPPLPPAPPAAAAAAEGGAALPSSELPSAEPEGAAAAPAPLSLAARSSRFLALSARFCSLLFLEKGAYPETDARSGGWSSRTSAAAEATTATVPATAAPAATARCCFFLCLSAAAASASPRIPEGGGGEGVVAGGVVVGGGGVVVSGGAAVSVGEGVAVSVGVGVGVAVSVGVGVVVSVGEGEGEGVAAAKKTTFATCVPGLGPLAPPNEVTTARSGPAAAGRLESVTCSVVAVAEVTAPAAPPERATTLAAGELASKPEPEIESTSGGSVGPGGGFEIGKSSALAATAGAATTEATCTAAPLVPPCAVTTAVRLPKLGGVENASVREVAVAAVTTKAPLLRTTELLAGDEGSKPEPERTSEGAFCTSEAALEATTGAATTEATCTGVVFSLASPKEVTETTDRLPRGSGGAEKVTVSAVAVAAVTAFATAGSKTTTLLPGVCGSKPEPESTSCVALLARSGTAAGSAGAAAAGGARTAATWTESLVPPKGKTVPPKDSAKLVTFAASDPGLGGRWKTRVSLEGCAAVIEKVPLLSWTVFPEGLGSKPAPEMLSVSGGVVAPLPPPETTSVVVRFASTVTLPVPSSGMTPGQRSGLPQEPALQRWAGSVIESPMSQFMQPPVFFFRC